MTNRPPLPFCPSHLPRNFARYMLCQALVFGLVLYLWRTVNGGWVPWFLRGRLPDWPMGGFQSNEIFAYFPETQSDGLKVTWKHAVNSQEKLKDAMESNCMFLEVDIILEGQGTKSMKLLPILAHPPVTHSDLPLEMFLERALAKGSKKGLKLDFKSLDAVEISLESLRRVKDKVSVPILLNADILAGPGPMPNTAPIIDPTAFIQKVKSIYPQCTLSLGWKTSSVKVAPEPGVHMYTWKHVKDMYDHVKKNDVTQAVTFPVNAGLLRGSLQPLLWLCESLSATLTIFSSGEDEAIDPRVLAYFRHKFPKDTVYYDLPPGVHKGFEETIGGNSQGGLLEEDRLRETRNYRSDDWIIEVIDPSTSEMLIGSQVAWLRGPAALQLSRKRFKSNENLKIVGSVTFLPSSSDAKTAFSIFLFTSHTVESHVSGIRCSVSVQGEMTIAAENLPEVESQDEKLFVSGSVGRSTHNCFQFEIRLTPSDELHFYAQVPAAGEGCDLKTIDKFKLKNKEIHVTLDRSKLPTRRSPVILRASDSNAYAIVEEIKIHTGP